MNEPKVGVVVVNYNCLDHVLRCVSSLKRLAYPNSLIIIVDSNSPDRSGERLQMEFGGDDAVVVLSPVNSGFAAACNIGISQARAYGAEYIWLLNPDTEVDPLALSALIDCARQSPEAAAFGSKVLYGSTDGNSRIEGESIIWSAGGEIDFRSQYLKMHGNLEIDKGQYEQQQNCDYLPGCSLLIRGEIIDRVGYLPEEYFMYFEESDWCSRVQRAGDVLRYVPQSVVWHIFDDSKMNTPFTVYYYNRNERLFWYRYGSIQQRMRLILKTICRDIPRNIYALRLAPDDGQRAVFRAHLKSCTDFLFSRFGPRSYSGTAEK